MSYYKLSCVVVGADKSGKTTLVNDLMKRSIYTKNPQFDVKEFMIGKSRVSLTIWDTINTEIYDYVQSITYPECDICICTFDICSRASYQETNQFINEFKRRNNKKHYIALVATNTDISNYQSDIYRQELISNSIACNYGLFFKSDSSANDIFHDIILNYLHKINGSIKKFPNVETIEFPREKCCCIL